MFKPKRILVTTDFTDESDSALREAVGIGEQFRSTVYLLHVIPEIEQCAVDYCLAESVIMAEKNKLRGEAEQRMDEMVRRIAPDSMVQIVKEVRFGNTVDEIVSVERERAIDLVMAAPHRKRSHWLGETHPLTRDLVSRSVCETMLVR
ncbi:MAG TPA: universal stress protein [Spirochaetota bacterium]|nr:universal stress protein [Spirochaetota bacterium]HPC39984.1 universal stress protein [Spirochaetota bacterium]HPL16200.1 universal stress protein [Spirochaetota bacterium]HQF09801.1 universal stress protein [Spirochaetota bacterium]HQH98729.1 universal stress protein [Spirochaetota bacterium]